MRNGFLLLNASLVFRPHVAPVIDARAWLPFVRVILNALSSRGQDKGAALPQLILWGKIAKQILELPEIGNLPVFISEHPYNLSFIRNISMQNLFKSLYLLKLSP